MLNFKRISFSNPTNDTTIVVINDEEKTASSNTVVPLEDNKIKEYLETIQKSKPFKLKQLISMMACYTAAHGIISDATETTTNKYAALLLLANIIPTLYRYGSNKTSKLRDPYILGSQYHRFITYVAIAAECKTGISFLTNHMSLGTSTVILLCTLPTINKQLYPPKFYNQTQWSITNTSTFKYINSIEKDNPEKAYYTNLMLASLISFGINFIPITSQTDRNTTSKETENSTQFLLLYAGTPLLIISSILVNYVYAKYNNIESEELRQIPFKLKDLLPISTQPSKDLIQNETPEIITFSLLVVSLSIYSIIHSQENGDYVWLIYLGTLSISNFFIKPIMALLKKCQIPLPQHFIGEEIKKHQLYNQENFSTI